MLFYKYRVGLSPRFGQEVSGWCRFHSLECCGASDRVRMTCFRIRFGTFCPRAHRSSRTLPELGGRTSTCTRTWNLGRPSSSLPGILWTTGTIRTCQHYSLQSLRFKYCFRWTVSFNVWAGQPPGPVSVEGVSNQFTSLRLSIHPPICGRNGARPVSNSGCLRCRGQSECRLCMHALCGRDGSQDSCGLC